MGHTAMETMDLTGTSLKKTCQPQLTKKQYITRVDGIPCMNTVIHRIKGAESQTCDSKGTINDLSKGY